MIYIQVCLVLAAGYSMLASAKPSYKLGCSANDLSTVELDAPSTELAKDCDPLTSDYLVTGSIPAPLLRTAVDIEPARMVTAVPLKFKTRFATSPLLSAFRPAIRSLALALKRSLANSKIAMSIQHSSPIVTRILSAPSLSTSYLYAAPQDYSAPGTFAPQYISYLPIAANKSCDQ